jgi:penicillin-binding protein 1B
VPSLALGSAELSTLEVARMYSTLASGGTRPTPHTFEDVVTHTGERVARRSLELERTLDPGTAYLVVSLLEGVVERGTAARVRALGLHGAVAGKTGTSDESRDLWFAGFTPELVVVVWVGFDDPRGTGFAASQVALPIWTEAVRAGVGSEIRGAFLPPPQVVRRDVEPATGALALAGCPAERSELFIAGTEPTTTCPAGGAAREPVARRGFLRWLRGLL